MAVVAAIVGLFWSNLLFLAGAVLKSGWKTRGRASSIVERTEQSAPAQP